jgi:tartrate/fumarate subfamily iron-sulfur-dependent hydro-lyase beta chain
MAVLEPHKFTLPLTEKDVRSLKKGDLVFLSGILYTGRDAVHKYLYEGHEPPVSLENAVIYHCGPVVLKEDNIWRVTAAGPTTSIREEPYQATLIEKFKLKAVIGKGGMGEKTAKACRDFGCVYLHAIGGAAQVYAEHIISVKNVYLREEFGDPEAIWELEVKDFPVVVVIPSS